MTEDEIGGFVVECAIKVHRETVHRVHKKELLTYLKLADLRIGYLLNFGAPLMKDGICRIIHNHQ
ncbi:MAG: hypothetical protein GVY10_04920 [Verrucomicrobia bacterium]|jgi:iron complex transport system substrate-binding protein|nr:hypothetical protein [Verrucomicrobiota bacterium]